MSSAYEGRTTLRASQFLHGRNEIAPNLKDIEWFNEEGQPMQPTEWQDPERRLLSVRRAAFVNGGSIEASLMMLNGSVEDRKVVTTSADGLSTTTQWDHTGSGTFDRTQTDTTVLNANGSETETIGPQAVGSGRPKRCVKKAAETCRSRAATIVWLNLIDMSILSQYGASMSDAVRHRHATLFL